MPLKKLKTDDNVTAEELIRAIEKKDRRFRLFQTFFMVGTFLALIIIISAQQRTLDGITQQQAAQKEFSAESREERNDQNEAIARRLNCIIVFFSLPDRDEVTIEDINSCALNRDKTEQQFFAEPESTDQEQPPNLTDGAPSGGSDGSPAPTQPQQPTNPQPPTENPQQPNNPVELDLPLLPSIPLCVPVTGICVR